MASLSVTITASGTSAYISGTFSGGDSSYSYPKLLHVDIYGYGIVDIISDQSSGGYNTFSATISDLDYSAEAYDWFAELYVRSSSGTYTYGGVSWAKTSYRDEGQFSTGTTYYAHLSFNANGGSGAPSTIYGSEINNTGYVRIALPSTEPTKSGSTFYGWTLNQAGTGTVYNYPYTITLSGSTTYPGTSYTLYAKWEQDQSGYVWIYSNGWHKAIPYIYSGGWKQAIPYVYNSGWKQGV